MAINVRCSVAPTGRRDGAGAPHDIERPAARESDNEIEITPAMIEAGVLKMYAYDNDEMFVSPEDRVIAIFMAMIRAKERGTDD